MDNIKSPPAVKSKEPTPIVKAKKVNTAPPAEEPKPKKKEKEEVAPYNTKPKNSEKAKELTEKPASSKRYKT